MPWDDDGGAQGEQTIDEALGIRSERASGVARRFACGCSVVRVKGRGDVVQGCLTCPGGDDHLRPDAVVEGQGSLF